jgi:hypothetical protein
MRYSRRLLFLGMLLTLVIGVPGHVHGLQAATQALTQDPHHSDQEFASEAATPEQHQRMTSQSMMRMMSEMKTADAKLNALVQAMNAAKGAAKTDAIAAVVTALIEERRAMHGSMMKMMNMMNMMGTMNESPSGSAEHDHSKP